ncbi:unnamed protein product, partial [marine sediment metagenome]
MEKLDIRERIYATRELGIWVGATQIIIPVQERLCPSGFVFRLANGDIVVGGAMSGVCWPADRLSIPLPPGQTSRDLSWRRSKDGGRTWKETLAWPSYGACQLLSGEIVQISAGSWHIGCNQMDYMVDLFWSDDGYTFEKERALITGMPKLTEIKWHRSAKERHANTLGQIVSLHDNSLLAPAQGLFVGD